MIKCNVDSALFNNNFITGFGFYFRNSFGQLLMGMSGYAFHTSTPSKAKALGLLKAIRFAINQATNNYF